MKKSNNKYSHPKEFFNENKIKSIIALIILIIITLLASRLIDFEFLSIFTGLSDAVNRFFELYLPPNFVEFRGLIEQVLVTFMLAVSSGFVGSFLAYFAALMISRKTRFSDILAIIVRAISTFMRNVPASIWAMILLISFWYGEFLAFIVMAISSFGFNARVFSNTFDEASESCIEALEAVGATRVQIISQSVAPDSLPQLVSWTLYSIETNIRDSTVVGMLTGGGIGYLIDYYRQFRRFNELTAAVILVVIVVLIFDRLTTYINEELLS